jgi:iron(III) transport system substrate-binding protein
MTAHWALSLLVAAMVLAGCGGSAAPAAGSSAAKPSASSLALYEGPDRTRMLEEGARKEGKLMWYTGLIVDQLAQPLFQAFQKKYPYVQVEYYRGGSPEIIQRVGNEYKVGQHNVDVIDGSDTVAQLKTQGLMGAFTSPGIDQYPQEFRDPDRMWGGLYSTYFVFGYNTKLVPSAQAPKTYADLLDPRWRGKLSWSTQPTTGAPMFVGNALRTMGQQDGMEYLRKLAQNSVSSTDASTRAVLDQVIGGEFSLNLVTALNHALISKQAGAPVDWVEPSPIYGWFTVMGMAKEPPHPNAALLFLDFIFSQEGQQTLANADYAPLRTDVSAKDPALQPLNRGVKVNFFTSETMVKEGPMWQKTYRDLFVK